MSAIINIVGICYVPITDMPAFIANHSIGNQSQPRAKRGAVTGLMGTHTSSKRTCTEVHHARV
ncbi:hypothetical protein [Rhodanobacter terrae]|uniref:Uncharacterized protein n=1 Tax=Rhodanobacter terrae TaxID=418647 RepID=A0ABW0T2D0_9GAMM